MAEAADDFPERDDAGGTTLTSSGATIVRIPKVKPPEKKKYEEDMEVLSNAIKAKESQHKALCQRAEDGPQIELHTLRIEKDSTIGRRKKIDNSLRNINQEITKQMSSLNTLQANLQYRNEDRINEVIRRLEHQMKTNNFSLRDEKKIVSDIDRLRRSRQSLVQYNALKKEIDGMRDKQRRMREDRDNLFKKISALKSTEEGIKKSYANNKERIDKVKKEIDDLKAQKSTLFMDFKNQEEEYRQSRDAYRKMKNSEYKHKKEEERRIQMEAYQKDLEEYEASREPYEDEKLLCTTLITYLQKFMQGDTEGSAPQDLNASIGSSNSTDGPKAEEQLSGMYVLRKKSEEDSMFGGIVRPKANKRSKRDKRKSLNRPIVHTPQIFAQFASLLLSAPPNVTEVTSSIEQLQAKKKYYENLPPPNPSILVDSSQGGSTSDGSAGAPSVAESAICESIPSTPEIMLDNLPPRFPGIKGDDGRGDDNSMGGWPRLRKLSKDSGTELEEPNSSSCDELAQHGTGEDLAISTTTSLSPGLDPATSKVIESAYSMDMISAQQQGIMSAPKISEMKPSLSQVYGGNGSDVTNSSSSTTPTNSIDNLALAQCNNNSSPIVTVANGNCQNQCIDSNSNPDLPVTSHGDMIVSPSMAAARCEGDELSSITQSGIESSVLESVAQEVLVADGSSSS